MRQFLNYKKPDARINSDWIIIRWVVLRTDVMPLTDIDVFGIINTYFLPRMVPWPTKQESVIFVARVGPNS